MLQQKRRPGPSPMPGGSSESKVTRREMVPVATRVGLVALGFMVFALALAGCAPREVDPELARQVERAERVTILRDDFGVPHIYGRSDADAVFGMLYAQSEDDFPRIERNYIWAIGRLAEIEGEEALYSDLRARLYMTQAEAEAEYEAAPAWLQELCVAFADGLNYYLHTHPEVTPRLLTQFEPWMPFYFFEGSIGGDIEQIPLRGIEAFYSRQHQETESTEPADVHSALMGRELHGPLSLVHPGLGADREPRGSNGFAISGALTASGDAMLLINPHTSFFFRGEVHVVSEEGLNAYGAVTWGQFFVYQGFNEANGWMHTSTYVDFIDEFMLDIEKDGDRLFYRYGDELRPLETRPVTLRYRVSDAGGERLEERTFETYASHHGPITHEVDGRWTATKINWEPARALEQSYTRTKTRGHDEFHRMMNIRTNSSNNTVYADRDGNIAYYHGNFVPRRDPRFDYGRPVDGSNPATDWQGLHALDETVQLLNPVNGWIQNANSTPFTAAAENSPAREAYPVYMAPDPENFRGLHAVRLLEEATELTLDGLIELAYDPALPAFEVLIPGLLSAWDELQAGGRLSADVDLAPAIDVLRRWDFTVSVESVAMSLAHYYATIYQREGEVPEGLSGLERISYLSNASPREERVEMLHRAVQTIEDDFGRWDTPWGEINRYQRLDGAIEQQFDDQRPSLPVGMASGRWGALASFGARAGENTRRIYGTSGNSFVAVVEFGDKVRARSLLAGGQSGDPLSLHFDDQAERYVERQFKDVAYYRDDVDSRATRTYQPGQ